MVGNAVQDALGGTREEEEGIWMAVQARAVVEWWGGGGRGPGDAV